MSSVFEASIDLEEQISKLLLQSGSSTVFDQVYPDKITEMILEEVERVGLTQLSTDQLRDVISELISAMNERVLSDAQPYIDKMLKSTAEFYQLVDVQMPNIVEAVRRTTEYKRLANLFYDNMREQNDELLDTTIEVVAEQMAAGELDQDKLTEQIYLRSSRPFHHARTNARMVVSGYNRLYRENMATTAGLEWAFYYGNLQENSRPFCVSLIDKVCHRSHIELMDNGQGLPVDVYCGGYNCIHSWLWIDLKWSTEYRSKIHPESLKYA